MTDENKKNRKNAIPEELQGQTYLSPKYDPAFKALFDSEIALKDFLDGALNLAEGDKIKEISFTIDKAFDFRTPDRKRVVFDIFVTTESNRQIDVEMQKVEHGFFVDRAILYKAYLIIKGRQNFEMSEEYRKLSKMEKKIARYKLPECVSIWICDFELPEAQDSYADEWTLYSRHSIECGSPAPICPKNKYLLFSLKSFKKSAAEVKDPLDEWLYLMDHADDGDELPNFGNTAIEAALERIRVSNADDNLLQSQVNSMSMKEDLEIVLAQAQFDALQRDKEAKAEILTKDTVIANQAAEIASKEAEISSQAARIKELEAQLAAKRK